MGFKSRLPLPSIPGLTTLNDAWSVWRGEIEYLSGITGRGRVKVSTGGTAPVVSVDLEQEMWVKLTASGGSGAYSATEVTPAASNTWVVPTGAWTGTVYEWNGNATLPVTGSYVVKVYLLEGVLEWRFQAGSC